MPTSVWNGATGNWKTAADWSDGVPGAQTDAQITAAGAYTVTLAMGAQARAASLELDAAGATLAVGGTLTVGGTIALTAGTLALSYSAVIAGGVLAMDGGTLTSGAGTLDRVRVQGPLAMAGDFQTLNIAHRLTVSAAGGGAGLIDLTGEFDTLDFLGRQTFDNATIEMNSTSIFGPILETTGTLTLGANVLVTTAGAEASGSIDGAHVINNGTIDAAAGAGLFTIGARDFVNNGVITADNLVEVTSQSFVNGATGTVTIGAGRNFYIGKAFQNAGTISVGVGSGLFLTGEYSLADLGAIQNQGLIELEGVIDNAGGTLTLGTGVLAGNVRLTGTIAGGTVIAGADPGQAQGATLDAVTWQGPLVLDSQFDSFTVMDGLAVTRAGGRPGRVDISGPGAALYFAGDQTFDNAVVHLGGGGASGDSLGVLTPGRRGNETSLTLGAGLVVVSDTAGDRAAVSGTFGPHGATSITNDGKIRAVASGGTFTIGPSTFTNNGLIVAANGDQLAITCGGGIVNAGQIAIGSGAAVTLGEGFGAGAFTNTGAITVTVGASLTVNTRFTVASLGNIVDHGTFGIGGTLDNTGQTLTLGTGPIFGGTGTVLAAGGIINGGTVVLGGGSLAYHFGQLQNLIFQGVVDLSAAGASLNLAGGVTVTDAAGTGPGRIELTGAGATLQFYDPKGINANNIDNVTIHVGNASTASVIDILTYGQRSQTLTFGAGTDIVSDTAGALVSVLSRFYANGVIVNDGRMDASGAGGAFTVTSATLVNNGQITVENGDRFVVNAALTGMGTASIATGGVLEVGRTSAGQTVVFADAAGGLRLDAASAFAGVIAGARAGDTIDLAATSATAATVNGNDQLVVSNNGSTVAVLQLSGDYSHTSFTVGSDGAGGSVITLSGGPGAQAPRAHAAPHAARIHVLAQAMGGLAGHAAGAGPGDFAQHPVAVAVERLPLAVARA